MTLTRRKHVTHRGHQLGWHPARPTPFNKQFAKVIAHVKDVRDDGQVLDLSSGFPLPVPDQGQLGACGPNSLSEIITYDQAKQGLPIFQPSRLFLYWNARMVEGTTDSDSGVNNDDLGNTLATVGYCDEQIWPYDISQFAVQPPAEAFQDAIEYETQALDVAQDVASMRAALLLGYPIQVGFSVFSSFDTPQTEADGMIPMPTDADTLEGGHDVVCVGHDPTLQLFKCRNSWGPDWGVKGYFLLPEAYLTSPDLAGDFKTVEHLAR